MAQVFRGLGVSPGVAVGRALPWQPGAAAVPRRDSRAGSSPVTEIERFEAARGNARDELRGLKARLMTTLG